MIDQTDTLLTKPSIGANWSIGTDTSILHNIHNKETNIAIYNRDISDLQQEILQVQEQNTELKISGSLEQIVKELDRHLDPSINPLLSKDIRDLLKHYQELTGSDQFRLLLATINTNMCKKFHTDINTLRLLCTYNGPGTLWVADDNNAKDNGSSSGNLAIEEDRIHQVKTGSVALLKGAIYPDDDSTAIVHRSPTIEETGERRLLLRIDTNELSNFWN